MLVQGVDDRIAELAGIVPRRGMLAQQRLQLFGAGDEIATARSPRPL